MVSAWEAGQGTEASTTTTTTTSSMRLPKCYRTYRRIESIFLGVLFISISCLLYQVLTTDHVTVMSWFGVKVNRRLSSPRQKLTSSMTSSNFHRHQVPNDAGGHDAQEGLFVDNYHISNLLKSAGSNESVSIAIGCAITSRKLKGLTLDTVAQISPFLRTFLPSFCNTIQHVANHQYTYKMFLAYDSVDPFFSEVPSKRAFREQFNRITGKLCPSGLEMKLYFVRCPYTKRPAWSQNDAMFTAYLDNADYFYRINDDTLLSSSGWVKTLVAALEQLHPPNVGVVGPAHTGGNEMILAHDFVHKTHMDIFGFYYPRTFQDWWADDWISGVYGRERTRKVGSVKVIHTSEKGTRYNHTWASPAVVSNRILQDRQSLQGYLSLRDPDTAKVTFPKGKKVISMSLYGDDPKYTYGAVRNAVLAPIVFPGWTLRVYVEKTKADGSTTFPQTPNLIIKKLKAVGAEVAYVDTDAVKVPPMMWRYLVADDPDVEYFLVRDTDSRLITRDAEVVGEWLTETELPFHCVRDHPSHRSAPLFGGLLGGRARPLRQVIRERWRALMNSYGEDYGMDIIFLSNTIWPRVKDHTLCHDSITCRQWGLQRAWPFPSPRRAYEHVGQVFDPFGESRSIDVDLLQLYPEPWECTLRGGESRQSWLMKQKANARAEAKAQEATRHRGYQNRKSGLEQAQMEVEEERRRREESKIPSLVGKVVIWSMDYETAYLKDLKSLLGPRGVRFIDKSLASDCVAEGTCPHNLTIITPDNGMEADEELADRFYQRYKDDPEMKQVTHFVCFRPVAMCELYMKFKKSIIAVATGRYEEGRLTHTRWRQLNTNLTKLQGDGKNIIGANNHYDVEYMRYFTGFDPEYLPTYCAYTETVFSNDTRPEFLVARITNANFRQWFMTSLQHTLRKLKVKVKVVYVDDLYPKGHDFTDLLAHPGIIHVPEKMSDIRVYEQYRLSIPLYFPSLELLAKWHKEYNLLTNRTFSMERLNKHGISIAGSPIRAAAMGRFDPNDEMSRMSLRYWLRFADFLHLPHVGHYDALEDLVDQLETAEPRVTSDQMKRFNRRFKREMITKWVNLINRTLM